MDPTEIRTPSSEPVQQLAASDSAPHRDTQQHFDPEVAARLLMLRNSMPWWDQEKFHFKTSASGFIRLSPNPEFLSAVISDASEFEFYGIKKAGLNTESDSTERGLVLALVEELQAVLESCKALNDREYNAMKKFIVGRCTYNGVYAAINQFEIDNWVARASRKGESLAENTDFAGKENRRDEFAVYCGVWGEISRRLFGLGPTKTEFDNAAKSTIYTQADMKNREYLNPKQEAAQISAGAKAAVMAARPFARKEPEATKVETKVDPAAEAAKPAVAATA